MKKGFLNANSGALYPEGSKEGGAPKTDAETLRELRAIDVIPPPIYVVDSTDEGFTGGAIVELLVSSTAPVEHLIKDAVPSRLADRLSVLHLLRKVVRPRG